MVSIENQFPLLDAEDEADLIKRAQVEPAVFAELYRRHLGRIYAYLRARVSCDEDAADLAQQVFLQAFDALPNYRSRPGLPFSAWLFQIARNIVVDAYRKRHAIIPWESLPQSSQPSLAANPEESLLQEERLTQLRRHLARLEPAKRELLALRFAAGLTAPQIAAIVGRSPAAVKKDLTRTLNRLKEVYYDR